MNLVIWMIHFIIILVGISFYIFQLNTNFLQCPNKEYLLWDANIRLIQSIDFLQWWSLGYYGEALKNILESPTWPPLRSLLSILLILIQNKVDPILDTRWSILFFFLTITVIFWGIYTLFIHQKKLLFENHILYLLITYVVISFLFLLQQIPEYLFNSMLEIQGMFVYTSFLFLLFYYYSKKPKNKYYKLIFFINGLLIYLTKYPYGVLISIVLLLIEFLRDTNNFIQQLIQLMKTYKGLRMIFLILPLFTFIFILIGPHFIPQIVNKKMIKNFMYVSLLLFFIDFSIFLFYNKYVLINENLNFFYKYFIFPFLVVIFSHPDRFHSLIGAQVDTIDRGRSFFISIFTEYFSTYYLFSFIVSISFLFILYILYKNYKFNLSKFFNNEYVLILIFLWLHFFILEFLTTNHQARYIFQLIPGILIFHSIIMTSINSYTNRFLILFFLMISFINFYYLVSIDSPNKREVCFAGYDTNIFKPVKEIKQNLDSKIRGVIFNEFHYYKKVGRNLENPYLFIPTDLDYHLRVKIYPNGYLFNYEKELFKKSILFDFYIYITDHCHNELKDSPYFKNIPFIEEDSKFNIIFQDSYMCVKNYRLSK